MSGIGSGSENPWRGTGTGIVIESGIFIVDDLQTLVNGFLFSRLAGMIDLYDLQGRSGGAYGWEAGSVDCVLIADTNTGIRL